MELTLGILQGLGVFVALPALIGIIVAFFHVLVIVAMHFSILSFP